MGPPSECASSTVVTSWSAPSLDSTLPRAEHTLFSTEASGAVANRCEMGTPM
jgi:hypothetical protein